MAVLEEQPALRMAQRGQTTRTQPERQRRRSPQGSTAEIVCASPALAKARQFIPLTGLTFKVYASAIGRGDTSDAQPGSPRMPAIKFRIVFDPLLLSGLNRYLIFVLSSLV